MIQEMFKDERDIVSTTNARYSDPGFRFPLNKNMVSSKPPTEMLRLLRHALENLKISYNLGLELYSVICALGDTVFEAEIVQVPRLRLHAVHFRRLKGDTEVYRHLCGNVIRQLDL